MASDFVAIEDAILAKIQSLAETYNVAIGKFDASELNRPVLGGQVFVNYDGLTNESSLTVSGQELRTLKYQILVRFVNLRTHDQAYPLLRAIDAALKKFKPLERYTVRPMRLLKETPDVSQIADAIWIYVQDYDLQILEV